MTLQQINKRRKQFNKADYEGKRVIIQKEIDSMKKDNAIINIAYMDWQHSNSWSR